MTTRASVMIAAFASAAFGLAAFAQAPASPQNRVANPTLDEPLDAKSHLPVGWYKFGKSETPFKVEVQEGRFETRGLYIEGTGEYAGSTTTRIPVDHTRRYAGRAWVKLDPSSKGTAGIKLDFFDQSGKYLSDGKVSVTVKAGPGDWRLLSFLSGVDPVPEAAQVAFAVTTNGPARAWFDDLELVERDPDQPGNLLPDGGLEWVAGDSQSRWGLVQAPKGTVEKIRRRVPVKEGWYSLQLAGKADWVSSDAGNFNVPLDRSKKYTLSGWVRARVGQAKIKINYLKDGKFLGQGTSPAAVGNQWQLLTVTAEPEKYPEANQLGVGLNATGGEVDALFDGLLFKAE